MTTSFLLGFLFWHFERFPTWKLKETPRHILGVCYMWEYVFYASNLTTEKFPKHQSGHKQTMLWVYPSLISIMQNQNRFILCKKFFLGMSHQYLWKIAYFGKLVKAFTSSAKVGCSNRERDCSIPLKVDQHSVLNVLNHDYSAVDL